MEIVLTADQVLLLAENLMKHDQYDDQTFQAALLFAEWMQEELGMRILGNPFNL